MIAVRTVSRAFERLPPDAFISNVPTAQRKALKRTLASRSSSWPLPLNGVVLSAPPKEVDSLRYLLVRQACFLGAVTLPATLIEGFELQGCLVHGPLEVSEGAEAVRLGRSVFLSDVTFSGSYPSLNASAAVILGDADFARCHIDGARFKRTQFEGDATFAGASLSQGSFDEAVFKASCDFEGATVKVASWPKAKIEHARFNSAVLGNADFSNVQFTRGADFSSASLYDKCNFAAALWEETADFSGATLTAADIQRARFEGTVDFTTATFRQRLRADRAQFLGAVAFDEVVWEEDPACFAASFRGARFSAFVSLGSAAFPAFAAFDGAELKGEARIAGDRESCDAAFIVALRKAVTPKLRASLEYGTRALRLAAENARDRTLEQTLYRNELLVRRRQAPWFSSERMFSVLYGGLSGYGLSVGRPLIALLGVWLLWAAIYFAVAVVAGLPLEGRWALVGPIHPDIAQVLQLSARSIFSLFGVWSIRPSNTAGGALEEALLWDGIEVGFLVRVLSSVESVIAGGLLFLIALGLRRRFQIS